jgi:hypothetical protein
MFQAILALSGVARHLMLLPPPNLLGPRKQRVKSGDFFDRLHFSLGSRLAGMLYPLGRALRCSKRFCRCQVLPDT